MEPDTHKLKSTSLNDIYVMLSSTMISDESPSDEEIKSEIFVYITKEIYDDPKRIIEEVEYKEALDGSAENFIVKPFFLNKDYVYPINLAGPAVSKVIQWNIDQAIELNPALESKKDYFKPGYFIDLRQLKMSRMNIIRLEGNDKEKYYDDAEPDTPIPYKILNPIKADRAFFPVPKDKQHELKKLPDEVNLYIAFFTNQNKTHTNTECYNYKVAYITAKEVKAYILTPNEDGGNVDQNQKHIQYLKTYYGDTGIQSGALNPYDILSKRDFEEKTSITNSHNDQDNHCIGGPGRGGGSTCYVANLATFKK